MKKSRSKPRALAAAISGSHLHRSLMPCTAVLLASLSGVLHAADAETADAVLPTVKVEAGAEPVQDGVLATQTRVGKTLQDPHDVPQAITTVTRKVMDEQHASTLREALRNVSGLTFNAAEGGRSGDNMMLRGFYIFGDIYLDGIRDTAQYNRELFNLEQVDVLRGSAAMLFGRGQAGGVINQVSKAPYLRDRNKLTLAAGTQDHQEIKGDFNKRIGTTSAVRLNLLKRDEGSVRSNPVTGTEPEIHRDGVSLSAGMGLGTDNQLILSHIATRTRDLPDYGVGFDAATKHPRKDQSAKTFWGIGANFDDSDTNITTATHQYRFSPKTQLRSQIRKSNYERAYWASAPLSLASPAPATHPAPLAEGTSPKTRQFVTDNVVVQSDLSTSFEAFGMSHEVVSGVEYLYEDAKRWGLCNLNATLSAPCANTTTTGSTTASYFNKDKVNPTSLNTYRGDTFAYYAQDTIEFVPNWKLLLGARRDIMRAHYAAPNDPAAGINNSPSLKFNENSYRTGLSWQPSEAAHYYVSYSDSFSPTADLYQLSGGANPPERSQVSELGAKWLFFAGDLAFRTAAYRADKEWERNTDLESTAAILTKKRRTDGLEFEMAGRITPRWEVFSGLALMKARTLELAEGNRRTVTVKKNTPDNMTPANVTRSEEIITNPAFLGQRPRNTPAYTFNVWSTYKLTDRVTAGVGAETKGERTGYNPSGGCTQSQLNGNTTQVCTQAPFDPNKLPSYVRWDAMTSWENKQYTVRLNVLNLLNKVYYDALYDNGGFTVPGQGRKVILTAEYKF